MDIDHTIWQSEVIEDQPRDGKDAESFPQNACETGARPLWLMVIGTVVRNKPIVFWTIVFDFIHEWSLLIEMQVIRVMVGIVTNAVSARTCSP